MKDVMRSAITCIVCYGLACAFCLCFNIDGFSRYFVFLVFGLFCAKVDNALRDRASDIVDEE